jgi:ABC-type nitrate/sulfonate/bicarbonate transport system substrate-binding protein
MRKLKMNTNRKAYVQRLAWLIAVLMIVALATACAGGDKGDKDESSADASSASSSAETASGSSETDGSGSAAAEGELFEFKIADTTEPVELYIPYLAEALGYFEEEGLKPVYTGVIPPPEQVPAVVAGSNDVGHMHANYIIQAAAGDAPIKAVAANSRTTKEFPHMEFITLETSGISEPKDLIGKKIGVVAIGDCNDYTPLEYLRKELDIDDPRDQVEFVVVPFGNEEVALREGEVDVIGYHGHPADIYAKGGVKLLFTDFDVWGEIGGSAPWFFHTEFIEKNPEQVKAFVRAISKANTFADENVEESLKIYAERVDLPVESVTTKYYEPSAVITDDTIQLWNDILLHYESIEKDVSLENVFTNEFNDAAK